ncbi:MAG: biopolymer transporter ExbD [Candidatus Cloacimonetes bacterium]|nr:biopolymer transporter ExbD [Candidatus Cloacimonadota bacterium]
MQLIRKKRRKVILNIISLIDVVLLLLIFFMLTTRFVEQPGMKLDLPSASTADKTTVKELELIVTAEGELYLNEQRIVLDDLAKDMKSMLRESHERTLVLKADRNVSHGRIVEIMDISRSSGVDKIIIATVPK